MDLDALEVTCKPLHASTYGSEALSKMTREKIRLASQNYRLRKKIESLKAKVDRLMQQNDQLYAHVARSAIELLFDMMHYL